VIGYSYKHNEGEIMSQLHTIGNLCDNDDCLTCMMLDLDATILANGGTEAVERIDGEMQLIGGGKVAAVRTRFQAPGQGASRNRRGTRTISAKQAKLIRSLISNRDTRNITVYPGQTLDPTKVETMGLPAARALIDKLLNAPELSVRMATEGQKRYIASLNAQIIDARIQISEADINSVTFAEVNDVLNLLKSIINAEKEDAKRITPSVKPISEGAYWHEGRIVRVQKARQTGNLYATIQVEPNVDEFEYVRGLINKVNPDNMLTHEEMKAFAAEFHQCGDCGRRLTNKESIAYGIGPICRNKGYR
jgi:hypothetical protein